MTRVAVKPELIRWAQERSGLSDEELRAKQELSSYDQWLSGTRHPTIRQLQDLARITRAPFGYFLLDQPPKENLELKDYRTLEGKSPRRPSPELIDIVHMMQLRQDWLRDYFEMNETEPLPFIGSAGIDEDPNVVAQSIRKQIGWTTKRVLAARDWKQAKAELCTAIEETRIFVFFNGVVGNNSHRPLKVTEFRGFVLCDDLAPVIFVNNSDSKSAQMFTLAHELAHLWLGESVVFDLPVLESKNNRIERWCNKVAAEFLVPAIDLKKAWLDVSKMADKFSLLSRQFKVSPMVAARRALELRLIQHEEFVNFYEAENKKEFTNKSTGGNFHSTQIGRVGRQFGELVIHAALSGELLFRDAYMLTGLNAQNFDKLSQNLGVTK